MSFLAHLASTLIDFCYPADFLNAHIFVGLQYGFVHNVDSILQRLRPPQIRGSPQTVVEHLPVVKFS
jgi:hypothetical protein